MQRAQRWLWWTVAVFAIVLVVTGVWLTFNYRPASSVNAFGPKQGEQALRVVHRLASQLVIWVTLALGVVHVVNRRRTWPGAVAIFVLVLALSFTGFLLPWDQLALRAVTIGTNFKGLFTAAFSDQVKFVLIDGREISQATIRNWFLVHAVLLPVALGATVVWLRRAASTEGSWGRRDSNPRATH